MLKTIQTNVPLYVNVLASAEELAAEVRDRRPDSIALFAELTESQREQLVHDAWLIGLRALHNAHSAAQEARLVDVGQALLADIDRQLRVHIEAQQAAMFTAMSRFFDPQDGQLPQRLTAFLGDQDVLVRVLEKYLAPQSGVLSQTLARQVGESSPLFRKLSPTDSEGLVKVLETQLATVMQAGHNELVRALDPLADDGAVARFLRSLREELQDADEDRAEQLSAALSALDANDEDSLIRSSGHRLVVLRCVSQERGRQVGRSRDEMRIVSDEHSLCGANDDALQDGSG